MFQSSSRTIYSEVSYNKATQQAGSRRKLSRDNLNCTCEDLHYSSVVAEGCDMNCVPNAVKPAVNSSAKDDSGGCWWINYNNFGWLKGRR